METIRKMLQGEVFSGSSPPKKDFAQGFQDYHVTKRAYHGAKDWKRKGEDSTYCGPSVVHHYAHPFALDELAGFKQRLWESSPNPGDLLPPDQWTIADVAEQMRLTAAREFSGDDPIAWVNFIAVFLFCAEVLRKFRNCEDQPLDLHLAESLVRRVESALSELDRRGPGAVEDGPLAGLKATFACFDNRLPEAVFWPRF